VTSLVSRSGLLRLVAWSTVVALTGAQLAAAAERVNVPLAAISNRSSNQVSEILGNEVNVQQTKHGVKKYYRAGIDIVFINGRSDWITIPGLNAVYGSESLNVLGLGRLDPKFSNEHVIRWTGIKGYVEISAFPGRNGLVDYFYVKTKTR